MMGDPAVRREMAPADGTTAGFWDEAPPPRGLLLAALRWAWDGVYTVTDTGTGLLVVRARDGESFTSADPLAARDEMLADFAHSPAWPPRAAGGLARRTAFERAHPGVQWVVPSTLHRAYWADGGGRHEEASPTADGLLAQLAARGFTVPAPGPENAP